MKFKAFVSFLMVFLVLGCNKRMYAPEMSYEPAYDYDYGYAGDAEDSYGGGLAVAESKMDMSRGRRGESESAKASPSPSMQAAPALPGAKQAPEQATESPDGPATAPEARKVHYDGWARLRVTRVEDTLDEVARLAIEAGGGVDRLYSGTITVRVPVDRFEQVFAQLLTLGDLLDKSISATDITEAFAAVDLRLKTMNATRDRLMVLLAQAEEEEQKMALLKQIQRLTEDIDLLQSQLQVMASLASFSRITIEALPRQAVGQGVAQNEVSGFEWIRRLSPFRRDVGFAGRKLALQVPDGFVSLKMRHHFIAESADGAVIWSGRLLNQPMGNTDFWMAAIQERLAPEFAESSVQSWGDYKVLRLVDASDEPYVYLVAVQDAGKWLRLVEIFYPGQEQETRYGDAVRQILGAPDLQASLLADEGRQG